MIFVKLFSFVSSAWYVCLWCSAVVSAVCTWLWRTRRNAGLLDDDQNVCLVFPHVVVQECLGEPSSPWPSNQVGYLKADRNSRNCQLALRKSAATLDVKAHLVRMVCRFWFILSRSLHSFSIFACIFSFFISWILKNYHANIFLTLHTI